MSVEAIVRVVEEESAAEAERIIGGARASAEKRMAAARASAEAQIREACERAEPAFRAEATRVVNAARVRQMEREATRLAALVDAAMGEASARLTAIVREPDGPRWQGAIARLVEESARAVGRHGTIVIRACDVAAARAIVERLGCRVEIQDATAPIADPLSAGAVGWSEDGRIEVDATLRVRLGRARAGLAEPIARMLGVEA
ncbi:MAG: V-type ATP synthase subunit E family protein [Chloroflexota bacterium]|nr:V-type ATP synthase subunit E family protein [Chloroflexota bacterium]